MVPSVSIEIKVQSREITSKSLSSSSHIKTFPSQLLKVKVTLFADFISGPALVAIHVVGGDD